MNDARTHPIVLIVDDDLGDQLLLFRCFERSPMGVDVQTVPDGEQALDYLFHRGRYEAPESAPVPDLVLLDINLPKLDGMKVLERLRAERGSDLPVVMLSTSNQDEDVRRALALGANSYIVKPTAYDDTLRMVRMLEEYWFGLTAHAEAHRVT